MWRKLREVEELLQEVGEELPHNVVSDDYYQDFFINAMERAITEHGKKYVKEHAKIYIGGSWDYVSTLP
ncbi:MAG: hypothetical protein ABSE80_02160 [Halobacteriota archaeon]